MPASIYVYIWKVSGRGQVLICLLSGVLIPLSTVPLDLQRRMVNEALGKQDVRQLIILALLYLVVVLGQQTFKYGLNICRGWVVEDVTRQLRNAIHKSFDPGHDPAPARSHDQVSRDPGSVVSMIAAETEDIAGFVGDSITVPLLQGGTVAAVLGYLAWVDWRIACFATLLYLPQYLIVRAVQQLINRFARGHAKVVRRLGQEIVAEARDKVAPRRFAQLVDRAFELRMRIYRRKFLLTYLGNFLDAMGPLIVLTVGGWYVIQGQAKVSTLVVFITGFQKVADPWDQLINFYRSAQIAQTKYKLLRQTLVEPADSEETAGADLKKPSKKSIHA
jgi:ABC-type bacteriocin/lantibiotic exporter with double-glycine peptidase domain